MADFLFPIKQTIWSLIRKARLGGLLLQIHPKSFLRRRGWFFSFSQRCSIDLEGNPIPWWSYAANDFIEDRLSPSMKILEFGAGSSTLWLSRLVDSVLSIENDAGWVERLRPELSDNVTLVYLEKPECLNSDYIPNYFREGFDMMVIDPLAHRINCAKSGLPFLKKNGVVVWDNTDGPDWSAIKSLMVENGFKEISFSGLGAQEVAAFRTTVFYRPDNVFGI